MPPPTMPTSKDTVEDAGRRLRGPRRLVDGGQHDLAPSEASMVRHSPDLSFRRAARSTVTVVHTLANGTPRAADGPMPFKQYLRQEITKGLDETYTEED